MKKQKFEFNVVDMYEEQLNTLSEIISNKDLVIQNMEEQLVLRDNYIESLEETFKKYIKPKTDIPLPPKNRIIREGEDPPKPLSKLP